MLNKCAKFHGDSPSVKSSERDWTFGDGRFCTQLCIENLYKRATWWHSWLTFPSNCLCVFHRRCLSTFSIPWCKKVKYDQKFKSRRGSCLASRGTWKDWKPHPHPITGPTFCTMYDAQIAVLFSGQSNKGGRPVHHCFLTTARKL